MSRVPYWSAPITLRVGQPVATAYGFGLVRHVGKVYVQVEILDTCALKRLHPGTCKPMF